MAYLFPPMDDEPPPDFIAFVAERLAGLQREAARLAGGARDADALAMDVLTDLAVHWRRLRWEGWLRGHDVLGPYLAHRLEVRTKQWREEQIYPVEVTVLPSSSEAVLDWYRPPPPPAAGEAEDAGSRAVAVTVAQRLADLLPTTVRDEVGVVAEAEIAWVHAYRRYVWWRYTRAGIGVVLLFGYLIHFMSAASSVA
ncbi:hypothetical protein [Actinoplanes sp. NPDC049316]|uniref:hypothetical protein n=1 Tax=Actinoplanes sp. NPDC049316 TaxID=3154727 RepID=UPI00343206CB